MQSYENLAQRGTNYFLDTMADFSPVKSKHATEKEQRVAYDFIHGIYKSIFENPQLMGFKLLLDDYFPETWTPKKEKPGLTEKIRGYIKNINLLIETIYKIVYNGQVDGDRITTELEIKPAMLKKLAAFGIKAEKSDEKLIFTFPKGTVKGLKLLALVSTEAALEADPLHKRERSLFTLFSHGVFDLKKAYTVEIFRKLFENKEAYDKLINYFEKKGFARVDNKWFVMGMNCDLISMDFVKIYGKHDGKIGDSWASKNICGIEIMYKELTQYRTEIKVHIPFYKEVLANADKMTPTLRSFISRHNNCGGCGWCARGKAPKFAVVDDKHLCAMFTFGYGWKHFYEGTWLPDEVGELMDFCEKLFSDRRI